MLKFLFLILTVFSVPLFADWHSWEECPEEGELYMYVELHPCKNISERQVLHIQYFNSKDKKYHMLSNGWWDVNKETLWDWFQQGSTIIYDPNLN
jgi:hypothetical protein